MKEPSRTPKRQNPNASITNREKKKNLMMLKLNAKGKLKRSFKDEQITAQCVAETKEDGLEEISRRYLNVKQIGRT